MADLVSSVSGVAALAEPVRRDLYLYVVARGEPVSREQAAEGVGVAAHTAKFHLDKLALEGLLDVEYRRLAGRGGPGAGRPTKLYRRSARELSVCLPQRQYAMAGELMARAIDAARREGVPVVEALHAEAAGLGRNLADAPHPPNVAAVLAEQGFEPHERGGTITLGNCPFAALARGHTELVCGMNLALVGALVQSLGETNLEARLEPEPGRCCVVLSPALPVGGEEPTAH
jgi:predicted ArsR family transcriptional regulator